ncbi:hypothetical protein CCR75_007348 [Bremia lactucae]|uniref:RxLR effector protein n=1 Tax=Bremia lactucae TaxID=4779 RepID=A0A976IG66_BRELC|nr:hypothetical protein CCR75_007348 [Bremia lactucae]
MRSSFTVIVTAALMLYANASVPPSDSATHQSPKQTVTSSAAANAEPAGKPISQKIPKYIRSGDTLDEARGTSKWKLIRELILSQTTVTQKLRRPWKTLKAMKLHGTAKAIKADTSAATTETIAEDIAAAETAAEKMWRNIQVSLGATTLDEMVKNVKTRQKIFTKWYLARYSYGDVRDAFATQEHNATLYQYLIGIIEPYSKFCSDLAWLKSKKHLSNYPLRRSKSYSL